MLRRSPVPFCPSAALPQPGAYLARNAAQTPLLAVRGSDGRVRAFRNACRHRGTQLAAITDVYAWKVLRLDLGLERAKAEAALRDLARTIVERGK